MIKEHFGFIEGRLEDKFSFEAILVSVIIALIIPIFYYNNLQKEALIHWGSGLIIFGIILRILGKRDLGKQFSWKVKIVKRHKIVVTGIYKHIRHPLYLGLFLSWFGYTLVMRSLQGIICVIFLLLPALYYRIYVEEKALIKRFGSKYLYYKKRTIGMLPFIY